MTDDVNAADRPGMALSLHWAAQGGDAEAARRLLEAGADVNARTGSWTPLHVAAMYGHAEVVQLLLQAGADVNAADKHGKTPLDLAEERGQSDVAALLRQHGAKRRSLLGEIRDEIREHHERIGEEPELAILFFGVSGLVFASLPTCLALFVWAGVLPKVVLVALGLALGPLVVMTYESVIDGSGSPRERRVRALADLIVLGFLVYVPGVVIGSAVFGAIFFGWREGVGTTLAAWWQWLSGHFGAG